MFIIIFTSPHSTKRFAYQVLPIYKKCKSFSTSYEIIYIFLSPVFVCVSTFIIDSDFFIQFKTSFLSSILLEQYGGSERPTCAVKDEKILQDILSVLSLSSECYMIGSSNRRGSGIWYLPGPCVCCSSYHEFTTGNIWRHCAAALKTKIISH